MTTARRMAVVALGERPPALHRDLEHLEVARRDGHPAAAAVEWAVGLAPDDLEWQTVAALQRHAARRARVRRRRGSRAAVRRRRAPAARPLRTSRNRGPVSDIRIVSTRDASKPGSTCDSATAVLISSAEPMSSTSASATSVTTRTERALFCRKPVPDRPLLSFSVVVRSAFELCSAGIRPKRMPVPSDTPIVNSDARASRGRRQRRPRRRAAGRPC